MYYDIVTKINILLPGNSNLASTGAEDATATLISSGYFCLIQAAKFPG